MGCSLGGRAHNRMLSMAQANMKRVWEVSISRSIVQDACGRTAIVVAQQTSTAAADWARLGRENASGGISVSLIIAVPVVTDLSTRVRVFYRCKAWVVFAWTLAICLCRRFTCHSTKALRTLACEVPSVVATGSTVQAWAVPWEDAHTIACSAWHRRT